MDVSRSGRPPLPSPGPSSPSTAGATYSYSSSLPAPRLHPLKPGSQKEVAFINYVDSKILQINRRFAKKFSSDRDEADEEARGYEDFGDVVEDLEHVLDTIWVSRTPTLQIPFLLSLAGIFADYLPAFPFAERPTICLADKLDQAFAILLNHDRDPVLAVATDTNHHLVSVTDRVRIRSVIERTRIIAVEASTKKPASASAESQDVLENFTDTDYDDFTPDSNRHDRDSLNMSISQIYERSLSILGDSLV